MAKGGKKKGSAWEREVSKYLTEWVSGQQDEYHFWRMPGSGGIATNSGTNPDFHGDILPIKEDAEKICEWVVFECKNGYDDASLDKHLKDNKEDIIQDFWEQVNEDAGKTGKFPILIFKKKGFSIPWLGIDAFLAKILWEHIYNLKYISISWGGETYLPVLYLFDMYAFFDIVTPEILINVIEEWNNLWQV